MKKLLIVTTAFLSIMNQSCISDDWADKSVNTVVIEQPIPGKFLKNVLIEDYTGTWCQYCPRVLYGLGKVENEGLDAYPVSIHIANNPNTDPYIFPASALQQAMGVSGLPTAMLNRNILWDNETTTTEIKNQIKPNSDLGIALNSTVTASNINLDVNIKFAGDFSGLKLVVYVLENHLEADQTNATSFFGGQNPIPAYEHNHVLRSCLTDLVNGESLSGTIDGATITKNFSIVMPSNIEDAGNISFVAFVIDATGRAINVRGAEPNMTQTFQINL